MNIVNVPINLIKENPENPRHIGEKEFKKLIESIKKFPQMLSIRPIVVNNEMVVLGGNMRLRACKEVGLKEIPIIKAEDLTPEQQKEFIIKDNVSFGIWDWDALANDFDLDQLSEWGLEVLHVEPDKKEIQEDDFSIENDLTTSQVIKQGDLVKLGKHRIFCGDSTDQANLALLMTGETADMIFTDPPYNLASDSKKSASSLIRTNYAELYDSEWDKNFNIDNIFTELTSFLKKDFSIYICTSHFLFGKIQEQLSKICETTNYICWCKPNPMPSLSKRHWTWATELINYGTSGKHTFNFPIEGHAVNYWLNNKNQSNTLHPTQKPIEIPSQAISHSSKKGDLVLDLFLGSGTTLIACEQLDRLCYGIELNPKYCDVIVKRYKKQCENNKKEFTCLINGIDSAHLF